MFTWPVVLKFMAVALVFVSGVCIIGFFLERIARLGRLDPDPDD